MHRCPTGVARAPQLAVVVPLHVADVVVAQQTVQLPVDVGPRLVVDEVDDQLVAGQDRLAAVGHQRPLGVLAQQLAVRVGHLRLDPDAELEPEPRDVVDDEAEAVGEDRWRHLPVAETALVVAAVAEPAVVEHEALGADPGRSVRQRTHALGVEVEVERLPGVDDDRARPVDGRHAAAGLGVQDRADPVGPVRRPRQHHVRRGVALPRRQHHLAGMEQLAGLQHAPAVGQHVEQQAVVAAPRHVHAQHLTAGVTEAGLPDERE